MDTSIAYIFYENLTSERKLSKHLRSKKKITIERSISLNRISDGS